MKFCGGVLIDDRHSHSVAGISSPVVIQQSELAAATASSRAGTLLSIFLSSGTVK